MTKENNNPITKNEYSLSDVISNHLQVGGIETSILDNGPCKGVRIASINTGSGLRYKVVIDRALDIMDAFYNQHALAWISHPGITTPNQNANTKFEWLRSFGGGLMTTCGLTHIGGPESDRYGERGLHGRISNLPAELISVEQPDILKNKPEMSITGVTRETTVFGPSLEIKRTISSKLGQAKITILDEVRNTGNEAVPHMILYHCNFGWPLVDKGTRILWSGDWKSRGTELDNKIFNEGFDFRKCPAPQPDHSGTGEACAFIKVKADAKGISTCALHNPKLKLAFLIRFKKNELPWLTNWQHWGKGEYVTAFEPGTNPPIGQKKAREKGELNFIKPGETRSYRIEMEIMEEDQNIREKLDAIQG